MMLPWIEIPTKPNKLLLAWEPPLNVKDRSRWVVGEVEQVASKQLKFRYFDKVELPQLNMNRTRCDLLEAGFAGYPAFNFDENGPWIGEKVMEAFLRRLPHPSRSDYVKFLENYRVSSPNRLTTLQLLGITEARSPNDGFALIDTLSNAPIECDCILEVAGCRYYSPEIKRELTGSQVRLVREPKNDKDASAVEVFVSGQKIGYVNRLQSPTVFQWLVTRSIDSYLVRINGQPERPRPYIMLRVRRSAKQEAA